MNNNFLFVAEDWLVANVFFNGYKNSFKFQYCAIVPIISTPAGGGWRKSANEYRKEQDIIYQFICEKFEDAADESEFVSTEKAFEAYKQFCLVNRYECYDLIKFKQELRIHNLIVKRMRQNGSQYRVILFYKLK